MLDMLKKQSAAIVKKRNFDDIIIIGAGEVGYHLARRLSRDKKSVTLIDSDIKKLNHVQNSLDVRTMQGSGTDPQTLEQAGIREADVCIAATNTDDTNLLVSIFASILNPNITRLARIRSQDYTKYEKEMQESGLDIQMMVNSDEEVVRTIDRLLSLPQALDYAEFASGQVRMVCYKVDEGVFIGKSLKEFHKIVNTSGILIAAIRREGTLFIPSGDDTIEQDDVVYFVYKVLAQKILLHALNKHRAFFSSACIVGGGNIGKNLALLFESKGVQVKIIESNYEKARELAADLNKSLVLAGDAREKDLLISENIGKMDVFVAVTEDDETNILTCLLAKNLGIREIVARVNKTAYLPLLASIGIEHTVSPRLAAVNSFLNFLSQGKVFSSVSIGADEAEIVEAELGEDSQYLNTPLKNLNIPKGTLILCIVRRGEVQIPNGNSEFEAKDRIIILGTNSALQMFGFR